MSSTVPHESSATAAHWLEGARPRTWANAFAPVIVASGVAAFHGGFLWWKALLALVVAWALIIGVNYANDYSDGIRGTDEDRTGPLRLTGSGLAQPGEVKKAAFISFGIAGIAGLALSITSAWWLVAIGVICILGAWFYTGGSKPYGYMGLGEVAVFVFFGLVAVLGTEFTQRGAISWMGLAVAVGVGSISAGVNLANNIRDIPTDTETGKITLAVRLGDPGARRVYLLLVSMPFVMSVVISFTTLPALLGLIALPLVVLGARPILKGAVGRELIPVIGATGRAMAIWALLSAFALAFLG
ncbi:1,4-dihydroxy-2-naphthoate polyprenyltransferase [uncultured Corynebacterium sp.]|uniref:1,4-dihydroxy-2-naphthoate polyprenyltransferase n=1 Tax=uncultured Corynebacterium sp. TaxID=159447 RepID=UPI0025CED69D|nr:1,4-dihydroxy-2-naphthoate polyprenyltransferase [uncultured Corynebacterium sp.]